MIAEPEQRILQLIEESLAECREEPSMYRLLQQSLETCTRRLLQKAVYPATDLPRLGYLCHAGEFDERLALLCAGSGVLYGFLDLADCVEDHELPAVPWGEVGWEVAANLATASIFLGEMALNRLGGLGVPLATIEAIRRLLSRHLWRATLGQNRDLLQRDRTEADCLRSYALKTGSACYFVTAGAALGGANEAQLALWERIGIAMGMVTQINNDAHDLWESPVSWDILNGTRTLPLLYLAASPLGRESRALRATFAKRGQEPGVADAIRAELDSIGAKEYLVTVRQRYEQEIAATFAALDQSGIDTTPARTMLRERYAFRSWWTDDER